VLFQMTYPGAPAIYYGDEVGMTGGKDPGCRGTMVWDPSKQNGEMLRFTRDAIALRMKHGVLRGGSFVPTFLDDDARTYVYLREDPSTAALVFLNRGEVGGPCGSPPDTEAGCSFMESDLARKGVFTPSRGDSLIVTVPASVRDRPGRREIT
jgi:glycosidase